MNNIWKLFSNVKGYYSEINSATLTGAIDVVVVKQEDGSYVSSPFHVRFGKMGVLRSREKIVDVEINGEPALIHMKLGEAGEAFFVEESDEIPPEHLACSPIPSVDDMIKSGIQKMREEAEKEDAESSRDMNSSCDTLDTTVDGGEGKSERKDEVHEKGREDKKSEGKENLQEKGGEGKSESKDEQQEEGEGKLESKDKSQEKGVEVQSESKDNLQDKGGVSELESKDDLQENEMEGQSEKEKSQEELDLRTTENQQTMEQNETEIKEKGVGVVINIEMGSDTTTDKTVIENDPQELKQETTQGQDKETDTLSKENTDDVDSVNNIVKEMETAVELPLKIEQSGSNLEDKTDTNQTTQTEPENENKLDKNEPENVEKIQTALLSSSTPEEPHGPLGRKISNTGSSLGSERSIGSSFLADSERSDRRDTGDSQNLEESLELIRHPVVEITEEETIPYDLLDVGSSSMKSEGIPIPGGGRPRYTDAASDSEEYWSARPRREFYPFSDQDTPLTTPLSQSPKHGRTSPHKYLSDTEIDLNHTKQNREEAANTDEIKWTWGQLPEGNPNHLWKEKKTLESAIAKDLQVKKESDTKVVRVRKHPHHHHHHHHQAHKVKEEGIYLDDLASADAEVAALYLQRQSSSPGTQEEVESGLGPSLPVSPSSQEGKDYETSESQEIDDIAMSLCGDLRNGKVLPEKFSSHIVTYEQFNTNPVGILNNPQLVIRIDKKYYNWQVAAPLLMSYLAFHSSCKDDTMKTLKKQFMPKPDKRRGYSWFSWRAANYDEGSGSSEDELLDMEKPRHRNVVAAKSETDFLSSDDNLDIAETEQLLDELSCKDEDITIYRKTTRLSSEQLVMLNLQDGPNNATFSVTTKYQGTAQCSATIYLWNYDDKVIISDIDGTITKSDVLGHILPVIGGQWAQSGVATLFSSIKENGYQFLYLTARAIGQARQTREYLKSVKQDQITLPDGPVLMSPSSLITAFHREVIEKKPEEFKIQCLRDIQKVFPKNPFYAGFGNKINDVWSYRAVGIPVSRIFTINHKGEVRHELTNTFQSSYIHLKDVVDQMFPPLKLLTDEFNSFMYWRLPLPTISAELVDSEEHTTEQTPLDNLTGL